MNRLQDRFGISVRSLQVSVSGHGKLSEPGRGDNREAARKTEPEFLQNHVTNIHEVMQTTITELLDPLMPLDFGLFY